MVTAPTVHGPSIRASATIRGTTVGKIHRGARTPPGARTAAIRVIKAVPTGGLKPATTAAARRSSNPIPRPARAANRAIVAAMTKAALGRRNRAGRKPSLARSRHAKLPNHALNHSADAMPLRPAERRRTNLSCVVGVHNSSIPATR